jgi:hypothetical protein
VKQGFLFIFLLSTALVFSAPSTRAQQIDPSNTRVMMQANFLYQFALNNNWPTETRKGKFVIGVMGSQEVFQQLREKYNAKPIGSQVLEIIPISEANMDQFCHVLFVDKSKKNDLPRIMKDVRERSTLVVSNWDGALQTGASINFKTIDGSIRYELSQSAMEAKKITPGQKILQWKVD